MTLRSGRYPWVVLAVATFAQASTAFVFLGIGALAGFIQEAHGLTNTETGLLVTAIGFVPLFALVPVGRLLDRHGERGIVVAGAMLLALGAFVASMGPSYPVLLGVLLAGGAGYASSQPGGSKAVAGWFRIPRRGLAMGVRQTGLPLGGAAAAAILPAVAAVWGWQRALAIAALVAATGGALFGIVYRNHEAHDRADYALGSRLRELLTRPQMRPVLWTGVAMVATQFAAVSYLMLYLRDVHGLPLHRGAWYLSGAQLLGGVGRIVLASWSDRFGPGRRLRPVVVTAMTAAATSIALALAPSNVGPAVLAPVVALFGFAAFGWYGPWVVHVAEVGGQETVGLALALAMTANQLGIVAAPPLFGLGIDLTGGYTLPWLGVAALLVVTATRVGVAIRHGHA